MKLFKLKVSTYPGLPPRQYLVFFSEKKAFLRKKNQQRIIFWVFLIIFAQPSQNRFFWIYLFINHFLKIFVLLKQNKSIRCRVIWPCTGEKNPREFPQPVQGEIEYLDSPWAEVSVNQFYRAPVGKIPRDLFDRCRVNWPCTGEKIPWEFSHRCKKKSQETK